MKQPALHQHILLISQAIAQRDFPKAVECVQRCKDILMRLPKEVSDHKIILTVWNGFRIVIFQ